MARKFLTHLDMAGNQIINASLEKAASDPVSGLFEGRMYYNTTSDTIKVYDGVAWVGIGDITSVVGTTNEVDVNVVDGVATISLPDNITANASTATKLATARNIALSGDVSGSASFDGSASISINTTIDSNSVVKSISGTSGEVDVSASVGNVTISLPNTINADISGTAASAGYATTAGTANGVAVNSVALGTDTTGNYVASVGGTDGVSVTGSGEGASVTIANTDKGSSQNIFKTISGDSGSVTAASNSSSVTISGGTGISTSASGSTITVDNDGVLSVSGTSNQISASTVNGAVTLSLPNAVTFPGSVTLNADPQNALEAATKQYVDNAVAGLDWHSAVNLLAASGVALTGTSGTLVIDGHDALDSADTGYRILLKAQSSASANGIYVYSDNGSTYTLSRATDADTYQELVGAAVFVMEGTTYGSTAWIQTNHYMTDFDNQNWVQFSGTGTYIAGNGLTLTGNSFSINTGVTVDLSTAQTLTNKTLTSPTVSGLYLSDNNIIVEGTNDVHETTLVFTDPTQDNTITFKNATGTVAFTSDIPSNTDGLTEGSTNLYFTTERAEDAIGTILTDTNTIDLTYTDNGASAGSITADVKLKASNSYLTSASGLAVDVSSLETKLVSDSFTKKYAANVSGSATSYPISHNFNTRDVVVNVYDNTTYDTVEVDVVRTDADTVTISFATAPGASVYRVVVIG